MSNKASAYVTPLVRCPDGAALTCAMKCILFCLADHHNPSTRLCCPGLSLLVRESLTSRTTVKRLLAYLEEHLVLAINRPPNQGRGNVTTYTMLAVDAPAKLAELLVQREKGVHHEPLSSAKGVHPASQKGSKWIKKGVHPRIAIRKEPSTNLKHEPTAAAATRHPAPQPDLKPLLLLLRSNYKSANYGLAHVLFTRMRRTVSSISVDDAVALVFAKTQDIALQDNIRNPIGLVLAWSETIAHHDIEPARRRLEQAQRAGLQRKEPEGMHSDLYRAFEAWESEYTAAHPDVTSLALADIPAEFHCILGEIAAQRETAEGEKAS